MSKNGRIINTCIFFLLILLLCFQFYKMQIYVGGSEEIEFQISIDDDFSDDSVLVVLNEEVSFSNKNYTCDDFKYLNCFNVVDLTYEATKKVLEKEKNDMVNTENYRRVLLLKLSVKSKENILSAISELKKHDEIIYACPDYAIKTASTSSNDTHLNLQWSNEMIELYDAWNFVTGDNNVLIGVADTGIDSNHPDLIGRINGSLSRDFSHGYEITTPYPYDDDGHGTMVGGIIGAISNNNKGIAGINCDSNLVSLKVLDSNGSGYSSNLALAINYAESVHIPILNFSGVWYSYYSTLYDFPLDYVISTYNGLLVCAAGNENHNNDGSYPSLPASINLDNIISVGAINCDDERCDFSNYGENSVDIYAPGDKILSTCKSDTCQYSNIVFYDGTRLCELDQKSIEKAVEVHDNDNYSWDFIVDNYAALLKYEPSEHKKTFHASYGYHYMCDSGTLSLHHLLLELHLYYFQLIVL